jgi:hypothetical protein
MSERAYLLELRAGGTERRSTPMSTLTHLSTDRSFTTSMAVSSWRPRIIGSCARWSVRRVDCVGTSRLVSAGIAEKWRLS